MGGAWVGRQELACAGGLAHCCGVDCGAYGGDRLCPASGGLRLRHCRDARTRTCRPVPIRPESARHRYYVTAQPQWITVRSPPAPATPAARLARRGRAAFARGCRIPL